MRHVQIVCRLSITIVMNRGLIGGRGANRAPRCDATANIEGKT
jgi:hypothetical protein